MLWFDFRFKNKDTLSLSQHWCEQGQPPYVGVGYLAAEVVLTYHYSIRIYG